LHVAPYNRFLSFTLLIPWFLHKQEQAGDIAGAATVLQEVNVETYGSLSKKEKVEFILEQMRLTLAKKDYVRAHIVSGKISRKHLVQEEMQEYKVVFFTHMADYHWHEKNALELAKDFHAIYSTPSILADETKWHEALQAAVLFLALAPYSNEQQDLMHRIKADHNLEKLVASQATLSLLLQHEIISYPLQYQTELESLAVFQRNDLAEFWKETLHRRVVQHNIRVVSKYYKRIHGQRLAQLLGLSSDQLEREVASMVSSGDLYAKIDRPADIIRFAQNQSPESILSDWASDIDKLLGLVEKTTHLIQKENMTQ
jgi:26S proteasome regulatory subunit N5